MENFIFCAMSLQVFIGFIQIQFLTNSYKCKYTSYIKILAIKYLYYQKVSSQNNNRQSGYVLQATQRHNYCLNK